MKVNDTKSQADLMQYINQAQKPVPPEKAQNLPEKKGGPAEDQVNLSPEARLMGKIQSAVDQTPDVRQDKVDFYRNQIQAGTYKVEPDKVAGKMVQSFFDGME